LQKKCGKKRQQQWFLPISVKGSLSDDVLGVTQFGWFVRSRWGYCPILGKLFAAKPVKLWGGESEIGLEIGCEIRGVGGALKDGVFRFLKVF